MKSLHVGVDWVECDEWKCLITGMWQVLSMIGEVLFIFVFLSCILGSLIFGVGMLFIRQRPVTKYAMSKKQAYVEQHGNAGRVASWASIVCFCTPTMPLVYILLSLVFTPIHARGGGEMGHLGWVFWIAIGILQAFAFSVAGIGLALWSICKTRWRCGKLGLVLNLLLPFLCVLLWFNFDTILGFSP